MPTGRTILRRLPVFSIAFQDIRTGGTCRVALFSPVTGRLTFLDAVQGPLPSWTEAVSTPDSPAVGAFMYTSKLSSTVPFE